MNDGQCLLDALRCVDCRVVFKCCFSGSGTDLVFWCWFRLNRLKARVTSTPAMASRLTGGSGNMNIKIFRKKTLASCHLDLASLQSLPFV